MTRTQRELASDQRWSPIMPLWLGAAILLGIAAGLVLAGWRL